MGFLLGLFVLFAISLVIWMSPVAGFAAVTAIAAFLLYSVNDISRIRVERPFFIREGGIDLGGPFMIFFSIINAVARSLGVGAVALFTFTPKNIEKKVKTDLWENDLKSYLADVEAERFASYLLFFGVLLACIFLAKIFTSAVKGRPGRWSLYRFIFLFGVVYSATIFSVSTLTAEPGKPESGLFAPPKTFAPTDIFSNLRDELKELERYENNCNSDGTTKPGVVFQNCDNRPAGLIDHALLTIAVFDDFIDGLVVRVVSTASSVVPFISQSWLTILAAIFLSSNLLQGLVIAIYVGLLFSITRRRERP